MNIDQALTALSDPTRVAIVTRLAMEGEVDATELAKPFEISQPAVSRHIKILEDAGWVSRRRVGTRRPIRLESARLSEIHIWAGKLRAAFEANYNRLDQLLEMEMSDEKPT